MSENGQMQQWFVVVTRKEQERAACLNLERKGYICYVPQGRKLVKGQLLEGVTLFPDRIFIWCSREGLSKVLEERYITHVLYFGSEPARISQDEVELLQYFTALYENIQLEHTLVETDAQPTLTSVPLKNASLGEGKQPYELLRLTLPCLGAVLVAEAPVAKSKGMMRGTSSSSSFNNV